MDESLGLVNGPHDDPAKCPTYYDGCNCTVETLKHNLNCLMLVEEERDSLLLQRDELQKAVSDFLHKANMTPPWESAGAVWGELCGRLNNALVDSRGVTLKQKEEPGKPPEGPVAPPDRSFQS
jgi:hypothetical protein